MTEREIVIEQGELRVTVRNAPKKGLTETALGSAMQLVAAGAFKTLPEAMHAATPDESGRLALKRELRRLGFPDPNHSAPEVKRAFWLTDAELAELLAEQLPGSRETLISTYRMALQAFVAGEIGKAEMLARFILADADAMDVDDVDLLGALHRVLERDGTLPTQEDADALAEAARADDGPAAGDEAEAYPMPDEQEPDRVSSRTSAPADEFRPGTIHKDADKLPALEEVQRGQLVVLRAPVVAVRHADGALRPFGTGTGSGCNEEHCPPGYELQVASVYPDPDVPRGVVVDLIDPANRWRGAVLKGVPVESGYLAARPTS